MSHARRVLPGTTYLVTRRCSERRFFLRPDALVNQVYAAPDTQEDPDESDRGFIDALLEASSPRQEAVTGR